MNTQKRSQHWLSTAWARLHITAASLGLLLAVYIGSYFMVAFACGAGWMEVETRRTIVWTAYWPISKCAVNEPVSGVRPINDANGWFFSLGWQWLHE